MANPCWYENVLSGGDDGDDSMSKFNNIRKKNIDKTKQMKPKVQSKTRITKLQDATDIL